MGKHKQIISWAVEKDYKKDWDMLILCTIFVEDKKRVFNLKDLSDVKSSKYINLKKVHFENISAS